MALDPQLQSTLDAVARARPTGGPPSVEDARRMWSTTAALADAPPEDVASIDDLVAPGEPDPIRLRCYRGLGCEGTAGVLVWYHGGGWVVGDLETADRVCRRIANRADVLVVSVDYRLAPEHPCPAAVEDAWQALRWVAEQAPALGADPERLAVGGDSAGGNLAALVALRARDAGGPPIAYQLLVYPATDLARLSASHADGGAGFLDPAMVGEWYDLYLAGRDPGDPAISPAAAADLLGLPPACVVTAGHDPLLDEGIAYAERLAAAAVPVDHLHYPTMLHGFIQLGAITPLALEATDAFCAHLRTALAPTTGQRR